MDYQTVDIKILLFTKNFTFLSILTVLCLSLLIYVIYFFIADATSIFLVYRTATAILGSPLFYCCLILLSFFMVMIDIFMMTVIRETKTPMYMMYQSIQDNYKEVERESSYKKLVSQVKNNIFGTNECAVF